MSYLEAIQSSGDQRLESVTPASLTGMRPNGQCSSFVRDCDRIFDRKALLGNKCTRSCAQISHECVAKVMHCTSGDQRARDVRTTDGAAIGLLKNFVQSERNSKDVELAYDLLCTRVAQGPQFTKAPLQGVEVRKVQRQDMDFVLVVKCTEFHSSDYSNSEYLTGSARRVDSADRIMIGECKRGETAALRGLDYLLGGKNAVGCSRVSMQVDERRPARISAHCS